MHIIYCNFVSALQVLFKKVNIDASSPEHLEILWIGSIAQKNSAGRFCIQMVAESISENSGPIN